MHHAVVMWQTTLVRVSLFVAVVAACGCHEELGVGAVAEAERIEIAEFSIAGVKSVPESDLRSALATRESSPWPWGQAEYFDRAAFETDLQRANHLLPGTLNRVIDDVSEVAEVG